MRAAWIAATLSGLATGLGALPFLFVRELSRRIYDGILGLGSGLMLAAATLGLLGEALSGVRREAAGGWDPARLAKVVVGFVLGAGLAALMDRLIPHRHAKGHHQHLGHGPGHDHHDRRGHGGDAREPAAAEGHPPSSSWASSGAASSGAASSGAASSGASTDVSSAAARVGGAEAWRGYAIVGALAIHRIPEGLAIGAGFAAVRHARLGLLLAIAVGLQNACEGIVMAVPLRRGGVSVVRSLLIITAAGLVTPVATVIGGVLTAATAPFMPLILAIAAGTLIFVTSNEIIPESHSHGFEGTASSGLIAGFLLTMILQSVLP